MRVHVKNVDEELRRLDKAKEKTLQQLARLYDKALKEVGKVNAEIFEVHQIMLEDEDYQDAIHNMICNENVNAEYAVSITGDNFADMFANMDDDYMRARSAQKRYHPVGRCGRDRGKAVRPFSGLSRRCRAADE